MNFIINLLILKGYNIICVIIDKPIKKRYYISYIINNEGTSAESIIDIFIRYIFRLYKLSILIIFDRDLQFVIIIEKSFYKKLDI